MRSARAIIVAVVCIFISTNLLAFDGQRAGFILGGGIGAGFFSTRLPLDPFQIRKVKQFFLRILKLVMRRQIP